MAFLAIPAWLPAQSFGPDVPLNTNAATDAAYDYQARVATDGRGNWVAVWQSQGGILGYDRDILVARSTDAGLTWTPPVALNADAATDGSYAHDRFPEVVTDGQSWIAVWSSEFLGIRYARSTDAGATWTPPATISLPGQLNASVHVATNRRGTWLVVWDLNGFENIWSARSADGGATWALPTAVSPVVAQVRDYRPRVATDGTGTWVAAWHSSAFVGGVFVYDVMMSRSTDEGLTWSAPVPLSPNAALDAGGNDSPHLVADPSGTWLAAWLSTDSLGGTLPPGWTVLASRSTDGGLTWSFPRPVETGIAGGASSENEPKLATNGAGTWLITMQGGSTQGSGLRVEVAASHDDGVSWSTPVIVSPWSGWSPFPATDRLGTWLVTWDSPFGGFDRDIFVVRGAICGDGAVGPAEECDGGGDCCSALCRFDDGGTACASDGNLCTDDVCDGAGACVHPANAAPCDDGDPCTVGDSCHESICTAGGPTMCPSPCETCDPSAGCRVPRDAGCALGAPGRSTVALHRGPTSTRDSLAWRWRSRLPVAPSDFGDPTTGDPLTLCVIDEGPEGPGVRLDATIPPGGVCGAHDCWEASPAGVLRYRNRAATPDGVTVFRLWPAASGQARVVLRAKGQHVAPPQLPLAPPVLLRLQRNGTSNCWESRFTAPAKNDTTDFRGTSD